MHYLKVRMIYFVMEIIKSEIKASVNPFGYQIYNTIKDDSEYVLGFKSETDMERFKKLLLLIEFVNVQAMSWEEYKKWLGQQRETATIKTAIPI